MHREIKPEDYELLCVLDETSQQGDATPKDAVSRLGQIAAHERVQEACVVCLQDFEWAEKISRLPCGHEFHSACILRWLDQRNACPQCNQRVECSGCGQPAKN